jgi:Ca2+-dependent lipid-binding protein
VIKKTLNPAWHEAFVWKGFRAELFTSTLKMRIKDYDGLVDRADMLGSSEIELKDFATSMEPTLVTVDLTKEGADYTGTVDLRISWGYIPRPKERSPRRAGSHDSLADRVRVRVSLMNATGLLAADKNGLSDPYCKLQCIKDKFSSRVCKKTLDPVWEQDFQFKGNKDELLASPIKFELFDKDVSRVGSGPTLLCPCPLSCSTRLEMAAPCGRGLGSRCCAAQDGCPLRTWAWIPLLTGRRQQRRLAGEGGAHNLKGFFA